MFFVLPAFGDWLDLPTGLPVERVGAPLEIFATSLPESAREHQEKLDEIEKRIFGLFSASEKNDIQIARAVYLLENAVVDTLLEVANDRSVRGFARDTLVFRGIHLYRDVRHYAERSFERVIRDLDRIDPGNSGIQIPRTHPRRSKDVLYFPNYRRDWPLNPRQQKQEYETLRDRFLKSGGSFDEIFDVTPEKVKGLEPISFFEFVKPYRGLIRATGGKAGHILLAQGKPVEAAGQLVIVKDRQNEVVLLILSNSSGSYRPDPLSLYRFGTKLGFKLGISEDRIVVTRGEPLSARNVRMIMRVNGASKEEIAQTVSPMEDIVSLSRHRSRCQGVFR